MDVDNTLSIYATCREAVSGTFLRKDLTDAEANASITLDHILSELRDVAKGQNSKKAIWEGLMKLKGIRFLLRRGTIALQQLKKAQKFYSAILEELEKPEKKEEEPLVELTSSSQSSQSSIPLGQPTLAEEEEKEARSPSAKRARIET